MKNTINRVIKSAGLFSLLILGLNAKASVNPIGNEIVINAGNEIKHHLSFPNILMNVNKSEKVEVVFTTSENGKVNLVIAKTENEILKREIEKQFLELVLDKLKSNVAYSIVFNIKKI